MNKRAQVVIIILWVLVILAIISVGVGHRVSMAIRLTAYQRDGLKAVCLAEAGINGAIAELNKENAAQDGLNDTWSTGMDSENKVSLFDNIEVKPGSKETFTVKYLYDKDKDVYLCMIDEERKININEAKMDEVVLQALLEECEVSNAEELAKNIVLWRSSSATGPETVYKGLGYGNKGKPFTNTEELVLVKGFKEIAEQQPKELERLMGLITASSNGKVNVNTCSDEALRILIKVSIAKAYPGQPSPIEVDELVKRIVDHRNTNNFTSTELQNILDKSGLDENAFNSILGQLKNFIGFQSQNFRIISTGKIADSGIERTIECVYDRGNKKIVFWHEN